MDIVSSARTTTLPNIGHEKISFTWFDYGLFATMLLSSALIGIYFGFIRKQSTANEYLLGGRAMKPLPIAMSMVASTISGVAMLAIPADVYNYGSNYWISCISVVLSAVTNIYVYLPVFHKLQLTSTYEYLKMRYDQRTRMFASFLFGLNVLLHLPLVIYVPALALEQVTDINIHIITPVICAICIFYTTIGGLKAVVWTDMLQFSISIGAMVAVFYLGVVSAGGLDVVFTKAYEGHRLDIDFDINPTLKDSFWVVVFGWTVNNLSHLAVFQSCVQKFMALPTMRDAKIALVLYILGMVLVKTCCVVTGLIMYAKYASCDPLSSGQIYKTDQILPFYVMDVSHNIPGLPGLFIAGVFCASLSTLSASLNCLAGTVYEDFVSQYMPKTVTQKTVSNILKFIVIVVGVISVCLVYAVEQLGNLLPIAISFTGVASGPMLGIFTLGLLNPKATSKGAFVGACTSLVTISSIFVAVQYYKMVGLLKYEPKPLSTDECTFEFAQRNITTIHGDMENTVPFIFRISYYYYTLVGTVIVLAVGSIVSFVTQTDTPQIHRDLLSPAIHRFLREDKMDYHSVNKALQMVTYDMRGDSQKTNK